MRGSQDRGVTVSGEEGIAIGAKTLKDHLIEKWRKAGMTEEQIKALLDE